MKKSEKQYPYYNKILHNFLFFSMMDIKRFTNWWGPGGQAGGIIRSEK